jgi:hypothetical protein
MWERGKLFDNHDAAGSYVHRRQIHKIEARKSVSS